MSKPLLATLMLILPWASAQADWTDPGLAYQCARAKGIFSVVSVMDTSSPEDQGTVKTPSGLVRLSGSAQVECQLGTSQVKAKFMIRAPEAAGMCGDIAQISIQSFEVDHKQIFKTSDLFNHYCTDEEALHSIEVRAAKGQAYTRVCYAQWGWGIGYHKQRCKTHRIRLHE